jgi:hypothetical protein
MPRRSVRSEGCLSILRELIKDRAANPGTHLKKVCFFFGAGADLSSGGITFADLKRKTAEELVRRPIFNVTRSESIEDIFEQVYDRSSPDDRALLIESLFHRVEQLEPADGYRVLVLLAEEGAVDAVVTTNFDVMIEKAQSQLGRNVFQIFAPGLARPYRVTEIRYGLPRKPYLKLHGDLAARSVTHLTSSELEVPDYDQATLDLLMSIVQTHDVVFVGYGGFDSGLALVLGETINASDSKIFWCNPRPPNDDSPLYALLRDRVIFVPIGFDELMVEVGRPVLRRPTLLPIQPTYLQCLFEWRVEYCNEEYVRAYGERSRKPITNLFARRPAIEKRLASFLLPNRPLAIISGPSGFGKTTIGIRLYETYRHSRTDNVMLIRSKTLGGKGDIEQFVAEQLGGLGSPSLFSLFEFERWLRDHELRLVLFVDAINEFSPDLDRCVQLFRSILRLCYFLPENNSALRVIVTVRQETWHSMLRQLDDTQLRKVLWAEDGQGEIVSTISCGEFTDSELDDALARLKQDGVDIRPSRPNEVQQLRDPYVLNAIADIARGGFSCIPYASLFSQAVEARLKRTDSGVDGEKLKRLLAIVAVQCLQRMQDRFREMDVDPSHTATDVVRCAKDLGLIVDAEDGFLQFNHDRTFEYFLALGIVTQAELSLETIDDLCSFLWCYQTHSKAISAARLYYQLAPTSRFAVIERALSLLDSPSDIGRSQLERELAFGFARDVLVEMTERLDPIACRFIEDAVEASRSGSVRGHQLRAIVRIAVSLPTEQAISVLTRAAHPQAVLAGTEATIFVIDKLVKEYLLSGCPDINLRIDLPYATFFADSTISPWRRLGRLLAFVAQLGPDNTHPHEYERILALLTRSLAGALPTKEEKSADQDVAAAVSKHFLEHCDRLLFNATPAGIRRFFTNPKRAELLQIVDRLDAGMPLTLNDFSVFEPYTQSLANDIEYHLGHVLFALSSLNDFELTLQLAEARVESFTNDTPPEEVDFFHAVLVYLHILHGRKYDEVRFQHWEEVLLQDRPNILLYRPGLERGERRGFSDAFDRVFEDGFGVIYPYGVMLPSARRIGFLFAEYRRELATQRASPLPLYTEYLEKFLREGRIEEAIQILQGLASVIVTWPTEGLWALRGAIGHPHPLVRRATVRVLAEAYGRHSDETNQFLVSSGSAVSDEDMLEIKVRSDARIGRRQVKEEEWARIAHFLFSHPEARAICFACLKSLLIAPTFEHAVCDILRLLGITSDE